MSNIINESLRCIVFMYKKHIITILAFLARWTNVKLLTLLRLSRISILTVYLIRYNLVFSTFKYTLYKIQSDLVGMINREDFWSMRPLLSGITSETKDKFNQPWNQQA